MLDRGRHGGGGGDPYDPTGRRAVVTVAMAGTTLLVLLALRAGYLAAQTLGWPAWPVAVGCALLALALPAVTLLVLSRDR